MMTLRKAITALILLTDSAHQIYEKPSFASFCRFLIIIENTYYYHHLHYHQHHIYHHHHHHLHHHFTIIINSMILRLPVMDLILNLSSATPQATIAIC